MLYDYYIGLTIFIPVLAGYVLWHQVRGDKLPEPMEKAAVIFCLVGYLLVGTLRYSGVLEKTNVEPPSEPAITIVEEEELPTSSQLEEIHLELDRLNQTLDHLSNEYFFRTPKPIPYVEIQFSEHVTFKISERLLMIFGTFLFLGYLIHVTMRNERLRVKSKPSLEEEKN